MGEGVSAPRSKRHEVVDDTGRTRADVFCEALEVGLSVASAAAAAGVHHSTAQAWMRDPDFELVADGSKGKGKLEVARALYTAAKDGAPWACTFWLSRRTDEFRDRTRETEDEHTVGRRILEFLGESREPAAEGEYE
jgi:ssDNA-binding replication factor A large subunit